MNHKPEFHVLNGNEWMFANELGYLGRYSISGGILVHPSRDWRIIGAVRCNNFGNIVEHYSLGFILQHPDQVQWNYKNGKQRVLIQDLDHGAKRVWSSHCKIVKETK